MQSVECFAQHSDVLTRESQIEQYNTVCRIVILVIMDCSKSLNLILAVPKSQEVSGIKLLEAQAVICEPLVAFGDLV